MAVIDAYVVTFSFIIYVPNKNIQWYFLNEKKENKQVNQKVCIMKEILHIFIAYSAFTVVAHHAH